MPKKNLIYAAFSYLEKYESTPGMTETVHSDDKGYEIYLKNAVVCLLTAKKYNPNDDVAIVTNIKLSTFWKDMFISNGVKVYYCEYNEFRMPPTINYSLSYYKLCATNFVISKTDYDHYCFMDCDEYVVGSFVDLWRESDDALLIKPNDSTRAGKVRLEINRINRMLYPGSPYSSIVHYSSGNYCATGEVMRSVMRLCTKVYSDLKQHPEIIPYGGDEVIFSLALAMYQEKIYSIKPYVLLSNIGFINYWVDTPNYASETIVIWHLPTEKRYALRWAFDYFVKTGYIPNISTMAKASRIRIVRNHFTLRSIISILGDKTSLKRNIKKIKRYLMDNH